MGSKFKRWSNQSSEYASSIPDLQNILQTNRQFQEVAKLDYGDHGLEKIADQIFHLISQNKRIALYADYDVDGTMSCVSWIWFFRAINFTNFIHYIPCRFKEGYGLNLTAVKKLITDDRADVIITMDTGITANAEAALCREHGVTFICTDHHKIQPEKIPDALILNPKMHPDPEYQELCGCGVTYVLLRKLSTRFAYLSTDRNLWRDLLALAGMATICDVVPLNPVNHKIAKLGVQALMQSDRKIFRKLREASAVDKGDEKDIGFRLGPRINAVGRMEHADKVIKAFVNDDADELVHHMGFCNDLRKKIQTQIVSEAMQQAHLTCERDILFLGGDWHPGVVGIAASKIAEKFWSPTWLFQRKDGMCKGSARSIRGFDVTQAMGACSSLFEKFGGHAAAGGFTFPEKHEQDIRHGLQVYAKNLRAQTPELWDSVIGYDCDISSDLLDFELIEALTDMKPFGHGFEEPRFAVRGDIIRVDYYKDRHTAIQLACKNGQTQKIMFFNEVIKATPSQDAQFIVSIQGQKFRGVDQITLFGHDLSV